jgi:uncharacterized MAPEG superfamily protein
MTAVHYLLASSVLTWIMIMVAAELRTPTWTRVGARLAFGNRAELPPASAAAGRADRAAKNMLENMVVFVGVFVAASAADSDPTIGSAIFFFARVAYFATYLFGVVYVRSLCWAVALLGIGWIGVGALRV